MSNPANKKVYMLIPEDKYVKAQEEMLKFIDSLMETMLKQKHDILQELHEARTYYKYTNSKPTKPTKEELDNFFKGELK